MSTEPNTGLSKDQSELPLPVLTVDLVEASYRSDDFPQDQTREQREHSLRRYRMWLALRQAHAQGPLAPTRDIDMFWHLHMLSPVAYHRDCMALFGRLLDHDGGFGKADGELPRLKSAFESTEQLWVKEYAERYCLGAGQDSGGDHSLTGCWHNCQNRCWHACSQQQR